MADIYVGQFTRFEVPAPVTVTFRDSTGIAIDISGWSAQFVYRRVGADSVTKTAGVSNGPAGQATYTWTEPDFEVAGWYEAEMSVANATQRLISERLYWETRESLYVTSPTIGP